MSERERHADRADLGDRCPSRRSSRASRTRVASDALPEDADSDPGATWARRPTPRWRTTPDPLKKVLQEGEDTRDRGDQSGDGTDEDVEPHEDVPRLTAGYRSAMSGHEQDTDIRDSTPGRPGLHAPPAAWA